MNDGLIKEHVAELVEAADEALSEYSSDKNLYDSGVLMGLQIAFDSLKRKALAAGIEFADIGLDFDFEARYRGKIQTT